MVHAFGEGSVLELGRGDAFASGGADVIRGGDDLILGGKGDDRLAGRKWRGPEPSEGGNGRDVLVGGAGDDALMSGYFEDALYGGEGRDVFAFVATEDSRPGRFDTIHIGSPEGVGRKGAVAAAFEAPGAGEGDQIDVSGIDARRHEGDEDLGDDHPRAGDQVFVFGYKGQGGLWMAEEGRDTVVYADVDDDPAKEFRLVILDGDVRASEHTADDFVL